MQSALTTRRKKISSLIGLFILIVAALPIARNARSAAAAPSVQNVERTIYLIRHGAYGSANNAGDQQGLTSLGVVQARLVAARLAAMTVHFDRIISSTLERAEETAAVIHGQLSDVPLTRSELLSECTPPTRIPLRDVGSNPTEAASCRQQLDRAFSIFFVSPVNPSKNQILVCHGNVIRYFVTKAMRVAPGAWLEMSVGNASMTEIQVLKDGTFKVISVGDVGHIPSNLQSGAYEQPTPELLPPSITPSDH